MTDKTDIRKWNETKKLLIGAQVTKKALIAGKLQKVFLSANTSASVTDDFEAMGQTSGVSVERLDMPNTELGVLCKKPFSISVVGLLK